MKIKPLVFSDTNGYIIIKRINFYFVHVYPSIMINFLWNSFKRTIFFRKILWYVFGICKGVQIKIWCRKSHILNFTINLLHAIISNWCRVSYRYFHYYILLKHKIFDWFGSNLLVKINYFPNLFRKVMSVHSIAIYSVRVSIWFLINRPLI